MVARALEDGAGRKEIGDRLRDAARAALVDREPGYWEMVGASFTTRARSWSQLSAYAEAGIERYRVVAVLDEATTPQCRFLNGREFTVARGLETFRAVDRERDPARIRAANPWLRVQRQNDEERLWVERPEGKVEVARAATIGGLFTPSEGVDLAGLGLGFPPYHAHCRSTTVPVESPSSALRFSESPSTVAGRVFQRGRIPDSATIRAYETAVLDGWEKTSALRLGAEQARTNRDMLQAIQAAWVAPEGSNSPLGGLLAVYAAEHFNAPIWRKNALHAPNSDFVRAMRNDGLAAVAERWGQRTAQYENVRDVLRAVHSHTTAALRAQLGNRQLKVFRGVRTHDLSPVAAVSYTSNATIALGYAGNDQKNVYGAYLDPEEVVLSHRTSSVLDAVVPSAQEHVGKGFVPDQDAWIEN